MQKNLDTESTLTNPDAIYTSKYPVESENHETDMSENAAVANLYVFDNKDYRTWKIRTQAGIIGR